MRSRSSIVSTLNPEKAASVESIPGRDRVRDFFQKFFLINTGADSLVSVSLLCAQRSLRLLRTLKIPFSPLNERRSNGRLCEKEQQIFCIMYSLHKVLESKLVR